MNFLIGSRAVRLDGYRNISRSDYDIVYEDKPTLSCRTEMFHIDKNPAMHMLKNMIAEEVEIEGQEFFIPNSTALYTIKFSHSFWDIKWDKTMWDISFFQSAGIELDEPFFLALYAGWKSIMGEKPVRLNVSNDDFFTAKVDRKYKHDDLHLATCYYDRPIYERCKKDLNSAMIDRNLFNSLSYEDKIKMVKEEAYAIAIERYILPNKPSYPLPHELAYKLALKKIITSLSKGWFPEFAVLNWNKLKVLDYDYVKEFERRIK